MKSKKVELFHEHILVKEPRTTKPTPWHQDSPYYFIEGKQTISFWSPMDEVTDVSLRCVAGSHKWQKAILPKKWLNEDNFYKSHQCFTAVPDPDSEKKLIREFQMSPGNAFAFSFQTLHGARGTTSERRRWAFSFRLISDDDRFMHRKERASPPFPDHGMISLGKDSKRIGFQ